MVSTIVFYSFLCGQGVRSQMQIGMDKWEGSTTLVTLSYMD